MAHEITSAVCYERQDWDICVLLSPVCNEIQDGDRYIVILHENPENNDAASTDYVPYLSLPVNIGNEEETSVHDFLRNFSGIWV